MQALIVTFRPDGMGHERFLAGCEEVAPAFAAVPGLISKTWMADEASGLYGGLYLFASERDLSGYLASDLFRGGVAGNPAFTDLTVRTAAVAEGPTRVTAADRQSRVATWASPASVAQIAAAPAR
jgi:hypothetical protein